MRLVGNGVWPDLNSQFSDSSVLPLLSAANRWEADLIQPFQGDSSVNDAVSDYGFSVA